MEKSKALAKGMEYCARTEKSKKEVISYLETIGADKDDVDDILDKLIEEGFIDEVRYAESFVSDKFRFNSWGKTKIRYQLSAKGISSRVIDDALETLDPDEYYETLKEQLEKKLSSIKGGNYYDKKAKLMRFAAGRGFESDLIYDVIDEILRQ